MEKKECNQLNFIEPIFNWIFFILVMTLSLLLLVYVLNSEFEEQNFKLLFAVLGVFLFIYGCKMDNGTKDLSNWYLLFIEKKWLIEILPQIPLVFFLLYFLLSLKGHSYSILLSLSFFSFFSPIIMGIIFLILKKIILAKDKTPKRKVGER